MPAATAKTLKALIERDLNDDDMVYLESWGMLSVVRDGKYVGDFDIELGMRGPM